MSKSRKPMEHEFGVWAIPATIGAVRQAAEYRFELAHYDAAERWTKRAGNTEINRQDVEKVQHARVSHEAAICGQCGLFHEPPACVPSSRRQPISAGETGMRHVADDAEDARGRR